MAVLKCKMCSGDLSIKDGAIVCECEYCGTKQTVPSMDNEKKINLFNRANRLRINCEFDKASGVYESIVAEFPEEAEAYWGLCLCKYGIEYVDDPATAKKMPTCHRTAFESIFEDGNFDLALEYADSVAQSVYRSEAKEIDRIQKSILDIANKETPFDVFICYKETAENGQRTKDSVMAQDIYDALTEKGYKVFFSRITLEDKLGQEYEPYIFAALNSARIMLCIGTQYEYYNAVWVKNEWKRFLDLMKNDKEKFLIPCYCDIDVYDIPAEFKNLQGQDMSKIGFIQDLIRGIGKLIKKDEPDLKTDTAVTVRNPTVEPLLKRAFLFAEDGDWGSADEYSEKVLDLDPENADAYIVKLLVELKINKEENFKKCSVDFSESNNYKKIMRFGSESVKKRFEVYGFERIYSEALKILDSAVNENDYRKAGEIFASLGNYSDAAQKNSECEEKINKIDYDYAVELMNTANHLEDLHIAKEMFASLYDYADAAQKRNECEEKINGIEYDRALEIMMTSEDPESLRMAREIFASLDGYSDSKQKRDECEEKINSITYNRALEIMTISEKPETLRETKEIFASLGGYSDSKQKCDECEEKIRKTRHDRAVEIMTAASNIESLNEAKEILASLGDSDNKKIDDMIEKMTKEMEVRYDRASRMMQSKYIGDVREAKNQFESLGGFRDAKEKIMRCSAIIAQYNAERRSQIDYTTDQLLKSRQRAKYNAAAQYKWESRGRCRYCGGKFSRITGTCSECDRRKDY